MKNEATSEDNRQQARFAELYPLDSWRPKGSYYTALFARRLEILRKHYSGGHAIDLCCGTGEYLLPVAEFADSVTGIDFEPRMVHETHQQIAKRNLQNACCVQGNARHLPFANAAFRFLYSYSIFYGIPRIEEVLRESVRVLEPGGIVVVDFGLRRSLNSIVVRAHRDEMADYYPSSPQDIDKMLEGMNLRIVATYYFQILPMWGQKPGWLKPLLHPRWRGMAASHCGGIMLDERISSLWLLRNFAFRRLIVAQKIK